MHNLHHYQHPLSVVYLSILKLHCTSLSPRALVDIRIHSWCYIFHGFGQTYNDIYPPLQYLTESLTDLKIICISLFILPYFQTLGTTDLFIIFIVLPFPEWHIVGIIWYIAISDWFLSLPNMHLRFFHVFSWLDRILFSG